MKTFSKRDWCKRRSAGRVLAVVLISSALLNGFAGLGARAAMRLPEEATSLEPVLVPANVGTAVVDTAQNHEMPAPQDAPRRTIASLSPRAFADRQRRMTVGRNNRRALAEFMGLIPAPGAERAYGLPFDNFQRCREFVAVNC